MRIINGLGTCRSCERGQHFHSQRGHSECRWCPCGHPNGCVCQTCSFYREMEAKEREFIQERLARGAPIVWRPGDGPPDDS